MIKLPDLVEILLGIKFIKIFFDGIKFAIKFVLKDAIKINAKALWLQDGVIDMESGKFAEDAGLIVVMNDCILRQHRQLH